MVRPFAGASTVQCLLGGVKPLKGWSACGCSPSTKRGGRRERGWGPASMKKSGGLLAARDDRVLGVLGEHEVEPILPVPRFESHFGCDVCRERQSGDPRLHET